jgi:methylenetetrahydrofolate dehydrogenase (NADP+) / methenyltetrahydrofolate cyclohydrolase
MILLDGKIASQHIKTSLKNKVLQAIASGNRCPHLAAILVGNDGASETYVANKIKSCQEIGYNSTLIRFDNLVTQAQLIEAIEQLNNDTNIDGILVQLPLPNHIKQEDIIYAISSKKDVDGFHPINVGRLVQGLPTFIPATPLGIMLMLEHYNINTQGKHAVVVGRSNIVGRPMSILLSSNSKYGNATVTVCNSFTQNLNEICQQADILIAALGKPQFVKEIMIKPNAVVIDVGITRVVEPLHKNGFALKGDVDFVNVSNKTYAISPVPGGVGPMTIAGLLQNTWMAYEGLQSFS